MEHYMTFKRDNPHLREVEGSEHEQLLLWAHSRKYILLTEFRARKYYTEEDLEKAKMWREKLSIPNREREEETEL